MFYRNCDIIISGLSENRLTKKYFLSSISYFEDDYTWCTMRAGPIPTWQNILCIFKDREVWPVAVVIFYSVVYLFYFLAKDEDRSYDCYTVMLIALLVMLNLSFPYNFKSLRNRVLFIIASLTCVMIIGIFNAFLFKILLSTINKIQIDGVSKIVNDFELVGDRAILNLITHQNEVSIFFYK